LVGVVLLFGPPPLELCGWAIVGAVSLFRLMRHREAVWMVPTVVSAVGFHPL
jgi:hypothetical protein